MIKTLSHFDFLFGLPSRTTESTVAGTESNPPADTDDTPVEAKKQANKI